MTDPTDGAAVGVEEIRDLLCGYVPTLDASTEAARAILDLAAEVDRSTLSCHSV